MKAEEHNFKGQWIHWSIYQSHSNTIIHCISSLFLWRDKLYLCSTDNSVVHSIHPNASRIYFPGAERNPGHGIFWKIRRHIHANRVLLGKSIHEQKETFFACPQSGC